MGNVLMCTTTAGFAVLCMEQAGVGCQTVLQGAIQTRADDLFETSQMTAK